MEPILSGLNNYLHGQMSLCGKFTNRERFLLSYSGYFFIIQSLHLPFLAKKKKKKSPSQGVGKKKGACLG